MKQGNFLVNFVMIALALALACYLGIYAWHSFNDPFTTTYAYEYTSKDVVQAEGYLVRAELPLPAQSGIVDVIRSEGEKVGVGQRVARVHRDSQALAIQEEMDRLAGELAVLEYAIGQSEAVFSTAQLDEDILETLVDLRSAAARSDYTDLEDRVLDIKSQVLKRDYTYGNGLDLAQLETRRQELLQEYRAMESRASGGTSSIWAREAGVFSALVDGYETILTPETVFDLTPAQLDELENRQVSPGNAPGKLVTSNKWYFVTSLKESDAKDLREGGEITVGFSGEFNQDVPMYIERVGAAEGGRRVVVLSSERYLSETLLLRMQSAEIIFAEHTGLRVPKTCVRMIAKTVTDQETGETREENILGVYAVVGGQAEFKTIEIVGESADYYVVRAATQGARALRAGDEVISRATELYDGKLLHY